MDFDLITINDIVSINKTIAKLYKKLADLEKKGKKNTKEYKDIIEYIKLTKEYSQKYYDKLVDVEFFDVGSFSQYVAQRWYLTIDYLNSDDQQLEIFRLLFASIIRSMELNTNIENYEENPYEYENEYEIAKEMLHSNETEDYQKLNNEFNIIRQGYLYKVFAQLIEDKIKNTKNKTLRNLYIDYKYKLIYIFTSLEKEFLYNQKTYTDIINDHNNLCILRTQYPIDYEEMYMEAVKENIQIALAIISTIDESYPNDIESKFDIEIKELFVKASINACLNPNRYKNEFETLKNQILETTDSKKAKSLINRALKRSNIKVKNVD